MKVGSSIRWFHWFVHGIGVWQIGLRSSCKSCGILNLLATTLASWFVLCIKMVCRGLLRRLLKKRKTFISTTHQRLAPKWSILNQNLDFFAIVSLPLKLFQMFVNEQLCHVALRAQVFLCQCHCLSTPYLRSKHLDNIETPVRWYSYPLIFFFSLFDMTNVIITRPNHQLNKKQYTHTTAFWICHCHTK